MRPVSERLWSRVEKTATCWLWTGPLMANGYGQIRIGGKTQLVHRVSYALAQGEIPDGFDIDHICRVRSCVNPEHLRAATRKQNCENKSNVGAGRSKVRGVYWHEQTGKWRAMVTHNKRSYSAGLFASIEAAEKAVIAARLALHTHNTEDLAARDAIRNIEAVAAS